MIVLDSSAAIEIAKGTRRGQGIQSLFYPSEEVIAPDLYLLEVSNVAWKHVHVGALSAHEAQGLKGDALALIDRFEPIGDMLEEIYSQAVAFDHSIYDMTYLVLARRNNATLATLDQRLSALCEKCGVSCITEIDF